jgi:protein-tyrosine phosphatase
MIDLHCHVLPGIDDGAKSLAESIAMCRAAATAGCEALVATPHQRRGVWWNGDLKTLEALRAELRAAVAPEIQVYSGGEIHVDRELLSEVARLQAGEETGILPLAGSRYLLLEFAASWTAQSAADLIHELIVTGWRPVLAHPELISFLAEDEAVIAHLVSLGATTQVTAMSLTGDFGRRAQLFVRRLVDRGLAHFVASDSHDLLRRPPGLARAFATLKERWGEATARALTTDNPRAVVEDRPLPPLPPMPQTEEPRLRKSARSPQLAGIARIAGILLLSLGIVPAVRAETPAATTAATAAIAASAVPPPVAPAPPDPFYLGLLRDGRIAYDRGDFPTAAKDLRLACFGLLDDPQPLTDCLVRLAVAQGAGNDSEGFRDTFRRLAEVEDRFGGYSKAQLPSELRAAFEQKLVVLIPSATLATLPVWRQLLPHKAEAEIAALPPKERRKELEARLAKDPRNLTWNLLAAELDLDEGKAEPAIARAEQAAAIAPQDPRATCMRGLARAYGRHCPQALADLEPCPLAAREARYATALLGCRVELGAWRKAEEQVRALPPQLREDKRIAALAEQVAQHPAGSAGSAGPAGPASAVPATKPIAPPVPEKPVAKPAPSPAPSPIPPATGQSGRPFSLAEREATERVHRLLAANSSAKDLKEALRLARGVADAHPDAKEAQYLAGETAYRNSRWTDAVAFFRRAGEPGDDRPELLFYLAVSLFEAGDQPAATAALKRSLPRLQKTPYVDSYVRRITGSPPGGPAGGGR